MTKGRPRVARRLQRRSARRVLGCELRWRQNATFKKFGLLAADKWRSTSFSMGRLVTLATILALCGLNSADAVGETKHVPLEKNVQGLIQAGYPRERAEEALLSGGERLTAARSKYTGSSSRTRSAQRRVNRRR